MPYRLDPTNKRCVQVKRASGWQRLKCYDRVSKAQAYLTALHINVREDAPIEEMLAFLEAKGPFDPKVPPVSVRKLGRSMNDRLMDSLLRHRHYLLMAENGVAREVVLVYREALETIEAQLARIAAREDALSNLAIIRGSRLQALHARIHEAIQMGGVSAETGVTNALAQIAESEMLYQGRLLNRTLPNLITLDLTGPDTSLVQRMLQEPLGGQHYSARFIKNHGLAEVAMRQSLATSIALGESMDPASRRLRRNAEHLLINRSVTITRSEIQRVANRSAQQFYIDNASVVKGITIIETLDDRTCLLCINQDGLFFPVDASTGSLPPYHAGCRGFVTPVTKSWEELGIDRKELPDTTRASMNGEVPASIIYRDWFPSQPESFQRQVLGVKRYELYKSGKVKVTEMVKSGRILPISELPIQ